MHSGATLFQLKFTKNRKIGIYYPYIRTLVLRSSIALSRSPDRIAHLPNPLLPLPFYPSASLCKKSIECRQTIPSLPFPHSDSFPLPLPDTSACIFQVDTQIPLPVHSPAECSCIPAL